MISNELLKRRILDSAIHGTLVKNNEHLKPIEVDSVLNDIPYEIPCNWKWISFKKGFELKQGTQIDLEKQSMIQTEETPLQFLRIIDFTQINSDIRFVSKKYSDYWINENDVAMVRYGTPGFVCYGKSGVLANNLFKIIPKIKINTKFLYYLLKTDLVQNKIVSHSVALSAIKFSDIYKLVVPIPPLEEQKIIVDRIDELFNIIDRKENNDQEKTKLKNVLKEKILESAIQGGLVNNDISLKPIDIECVTDDIPFEIPSNWRWAKMKDIVHINPRNKLDDEVEVSFLPMTNIDGGFISNFNDDTRQWKAVKSGFTHFANNDVIIAKITPCFENRKSAYMHDLTNGFGAGTTELHVLRDDKNIMYMPYLLWYSKTPYLINSGKDKFTGTAGQQRISKKWLEDFLVSVPPLEEQKRIVEKIESLFELIEQL